MSWHCENCGHENRDLAAHTDDVETCWECDKPRGWSYDGPRETGDEPNPVDVERDRMVEARRLK